jgi:cell division protein DivIC
MSKSKQRLVINPFKPLINRLPVGLQSRYFLVIMLFLLWMLIFDKADVFTQLKLKRTIGNLENDKVYYREKLKEVQQEKEDMQNNPEKFAREHYFMKNPDEDVFVIDKKESENEK